MARSASYDFQNLSNVVKAWGKSNPIPKSFTVDLKQAKQLLKDSGNNVDAVKRALIGAGASATDTKMLVRSLTAQVDDAKKASLGLFGVWRKALYTTFSPSGAKNIENFFGKFKSVGGAALGVAGSALHKVTEYGEGVFEKVLDVAQFREASIKGLEYILGKRELTGRESVEEAATQHKKNLEAELATAKLFKESLKLAQEAPISDREIVQAVKDFTTQGYKPEQALKLTQYMADQQSKFLEDPMVKHNFVTAFSRMKGRGVATNRDLESLRIAKFQQEDILKNLLNQPGMEGAMKDYKGGKYAVKASELEQAAGEHEGATLTELHAIIKLKKVLSAGQISGMTLANAALDSVNPDRDKAGELAALKAKSTLVGAVNNAQNAFENLLLSMDLAGSKGMMALKDFLNQFTHVLGHSEKMKATIEGLTDALLAPLKKLTEHDMERVIDTIGELAKGVMKFFEMAWGWLDKLVHAKPGAFLESIKDVLIDVGTLLGQGIIKGVIGGGVKVAAEATGTSRYSSTAQGSTAKAWGNLWEDTGGRVSSGLYNLIAPQSKQENTDKPPNWVDNISHMANGGVVSRPTLAVIGEDGPEEVNPLSKGRGRSGGMSITVPIQLFYAGSADPDALEAALEPVAMRVMQNVFQRTAMEMG